MLVGTKHFVVAHVMSGLTLEESVFIGLYLEGFFYGEIIFCWTIAKQSNITAIQDSILVYSPSIYNAKHRKIRRKVSFSMLSVLCMFYLLLPSSLI